MTRIAGAGAGIAGLTCALALHAAGYTDITVLERANTVAPLGSGINVLPAAVRELDRLGLLPELTTLAVPTAQVVYTTQRGQLIWWEDRGTAAGFRWPQLAIHRGWLQTALARQVRERLGADCIRTGAELLPEPETGPDATLSYRDRTDDTTGADRVRPADRRRRHPVRGPRDRPPRRPGSADSNRLRRRWPTSRNASSSRESRTDSSPQAPSIRPSCRTWPRPPAINSPGAWAPATPAGRSWSCSAGMTPNHSICRS